MADFSFITERLAVGAQINTVEDMTAIVAAGVTYIIDAQIERSDGTLIPADIDYDWAPAADDGQPKPASWFRRPIAYGLNMLSQPGAIMMTHCAAGVNRGPSLAYAILRAQGWSSQAALDLIHTQRPVTIDGIRYWQDAELALKGYGWTR